MGLEIERKFLVKTEIIEKYLLDGKLYKQGYLTNDPTRTVRVRIADNQGFITIKGKSERISRVEYEYSIPVEEAESLLLLSLNEPIEKIRYKIIYKGHLWEVDRFLGANEGLWIAEIELQDESESFEKPIWLGEEVSDDVRYYNAYIAQHPLKRKG
ncbi:MAG: CYTH domain-containing protein [Paludibacteraceae bacterium]|nr:CYTH domain-containing protein [Paludibacteraceae bacterium]